MAKNANLNQFRQLLSRCKVEADVHADLAADKIDELKALHRSLRDKLLPQLYEYGILS